VGDDAQPYRPYATVGRAMAGVPYPRPWRRLLASMLDGAIVGVPVGLLYRSDAWVLGVVVSVAYVVGLTAWRGQTVGKLVLRIRVVDEADGTTPSLQRCVVRWFVAVGFATGLRTIPGPRSLEVTMVWLAFVASVVVLVPILHDPRRRGWHDRFAGTVVIDASSNPVDLRAEDAGFDAEELGEPG